MTIHGHNKFRAFRRQTGAGAAFFLVILLLARAGEEETGISAMVLTDKREPFVYETFNLTLVVSARGTRLGKQIDVLSPADPAKLRILGGYTELPIEWRQDGARLDETRRYRCEARALVPGPLTIAPSLRVSKLMRAREGGGEDVWREDPVPADVSADGAVLSVRPLPESGRPSDFRGAVGSFTLDVLPSTLDARIDAPLSVAVKIAGTGYIPDGYLPRMSPGRGFRVSDPVPIPADAPTDRLFEQVLIPQTANAAQLPAVSFSYFDPAAAEYRTLVKGPLALRYDRLDPGGSVRARSLSSGRIGTAEAGAAKCIAWLLMAAAATALGLVLLVLRRVFLPKNRILLACALGAVVLAQAYTLCRALITPGVLRPVKATVLAAEQARIAPAACSIVAFEVPRGAQVSVLDTADRWAKIQHEDRRGWIPISALGPKQGSGAQMSP